MATLREPRLRGMSVEPRPMAAAERTQFGLPEDISDQVKQRAGDMASSRRAAMPAGTAPAVPDAAPQSRMGSLRERVGSMVAGRPAAPTSAGPAKAPTMPGTGTLKGVSVGGTARAPITARGALGVAGKLAAPVGLGMSAAQTMGTDTETYRDRFNMPTDNPTLAGDIGVRALGAVVDVADTATGGMVNSFLDDRASLRKPVAAAPAAAPGELVLPRPSGTTLPSTGAGAGRGSNNDPNRTDVDPTDPRFGAARDFTRDLASVPRDLPADMREGVIQKTFDAIGRPVYSGRNVGANAQMVDGMGRTLRGGGTVSTVGGMAPGEAQAILARPSPGSRGVGGGNGSGGSGGSGGFVASGGLFDTPKARRAAQSLNLTEQNMRLDNAATLRGQDVTARGQELNYDATLAGVAQRDAAARLPMQAAAATRARTASYLRGPQGERVDPAAAVNLALAAGDTEAAEALSKQADAGDARTTKRDAAVDTLLKPLSTAVDEDGKGRVDEALLQRNRDILGSVATQLGKKSVDELLEDGPAARAAVKIINGMNSRKDNGLLQSVGFDGPSTSLRQLPEFGGGQSEEVGFIEGMLKPQVQRGDRKISLRGGQVAYLPKDVFSDQDVQSFLRGRGLEK